MPIRARRHIATPTAAGNVPRPRLAKAIILGLIGIVAVCGCATKSAEQRLVETPRVCECDYSRGGDGSGAFTVPYTAVFAGTFHLYRATEWDSLSVPRNGHRIASAQVGAGDQVCFEWVDLRSHWWGKTGSDLVARAGATTIPLGKASVHTRYYWCYGDNWDVFWKRFPGKVMGGIGAMFLAPRPI